MYQKTIVITAVLAVSVLAVFATTTMTAYADKSETNTEQELKQKNVGSGESLNDNCGANLLNDVASLVTCAGVD